MVTPSLTSPGVDESRPDNDPPPFCVGASLMRALSFLPLRNPWFQFLTSGVSAIRQPISPHSPKPTALITPCNARIAPRSSRGTGRAVVRSA